MQLNEKILGAEKVKVKNDEQRRQIMAFELKMQAERSNLEAEKQDKEHIVRMGVMVAGDAGRDKTGQENTGRKSGQARRRKETTDTAAPGEGENRDWEARN